MAKGKKSGAYSRALSKLRNLPTPMRKYAFDIKAPQLLPGVVPAEKTAPVMAADSQATYTMLNSAYPGGGFPGYPYLASLATRPEYRAMASSLATELTREWIKLTSKETNSDATKGKIKKIETEFKRLDVAGVFKRASEHDSQYGRAQIFIDIDNAKRKQPLILDPRTVRKGSLLRIATVEATWTTPSAYDAQDPAAPSFYKPSHWFMLGQEVHASRLLTIITRPLPDILKPAFNFSGMSLFQLAEPYVDNWLRTRQSVADLVNNFSITALKTDMSQMLQDGDDGSDLFTRADFFTATRSNKGLMLLDMNSEELAQINTPLSGLAELQTQSQEQLCSVSHIPALILLGVEPGGLNASSDGVIRTFYDWIAALQRSDWTAPLETILKVVQLSLFGEIDPDIGFEWVPLYQMTPKELAEIRTADSQSDANYVNVGVLDPSEVRQKLAADPDSGYNGLDVDAVPEPPEVEDDPKPDGGANDAAEWDEGKHPRASNGQFGSGGGGERKTSPGLSDHERAIETRFHDAVEQHGPKLVATYLERFGNTIDPDKVKALDPDFEKNPNLAAAVHEPSSKLAKMIYADALQAKASSGDKSPVVFTAGGSGSGKSTTMPHALRELDAKPDGLIYDSVLSSFESAKSRIDQALQVTEAPVGIAYTNADIETALKLNAARKRSVSIDTLMHAHVGASDTLRKLAEHYRDDPRVKISVINNLGSIDDVAPGSIADVPKYEAFGLRKRLVAVAEKLHADGHIDEAKLKLLLT